MCIIQYYFNVPFIKPGYIVCLMQIKKIKDDIEYYIEAAHSDPDFEENAYIYDEINFEDFTEVVVGPVAST